MTHENEPFAAMHEFQPECERSIRSWWPSRTKIARKTEPKQPVEFSELSELDAMIVSAARLA